jgi:hypothetical protein
MTTKDVHRLFLDFHKFTMKEVAVNLIARLTPEHWNNFPKATPRHDAEKGENVVINADCENRLQCLFP